MKRSPSSFALIAALFVVSLSTTTAQTQASRPAPPQPPKTTRLYLFDCGLINVNRAGTERYKVTPEEVGETRFSVPCFLVVHPKGRLMWDLGIVPDDTVEARERGEQGNTTATSAAVATVTRTLRSQLAEVGYRSSDITYFAFSHAHVDHNANANLFAGSTWLARPAERAFMWEDGNTRINRTLAASRVMVEEYLTRTKTEIWIEHDFAANAKLKKSPAYYD